MPQPAVIGGDLVTTPDSLEVLDPATGGLLDATAS